MSFTGGDTFEITYNHPTIGSGRFLVKAGEDTTLDPGGMRTEDDNAGVTGNGEMIRKISRKRWNYEAPIAWDANDVNELAVLAQLHESPIDAEWTLEFFNGTVWGGTGRPVGDIAGSISNAQIPFKVQGGGSLKKIAG